jgi:hypothetical protein
MSFDKLIRPVADLLPKTPESMNMDSQGTVTQMVAPPVNPNPDIPQPDKLSKIRIISDYDRATPPETATVLLNPNSISEQKSSNWVKHYIPGRESPALQWINGTERIVSFQVRINKDLAQNATVTAETAKQKGFSLDTNVKFNLNSAVTTKTASLLKKLVGNKFEPFNPSVRPSVSYYDLDIASYLEYYRNLLRPRKSKRKNQVQSPPLVRLDMGDLLGPRELERDRRYILVSYNTVITKLSPDLKPIDATVSLTFIEYQPNARLSVNQNEAKFESIQVNDPGKAILVTNVRSRAV